MKKRNLRAVLLPTNTPDQGRYVHYKFRNLYPGTSPQGLKSLALGPTLICYGDELADRESFGRFSNMAFHIKDLKRRIRRHLGIKALAVAKIA